MQWKVGTMHSTMLLALPIQKTIKLPGKLQQEQHSMALLRHQLELGVQPGKKYHVIVSEALHTIVTDSQKQRSPLIFLGDISTVLNINVV
jgi:hypothetical protein